LVLFSLVPNSTQQFWKNDKIVKQWQQPDDVNTVVNSNSNKNGNAGVASSSSNNAQQPINTGLGSLIASYQDSHKDIKEVVDYNKNYAPSPAVVPAAAAAASAATYDHAPALKPQQPQPNSAPAYPSYEYKYPSYSPPEYKPPAYSPPASYEYKAPSYEYKQPSYEYKQPSYEYKQPSYEYKQPASYEYKQPAYESHEYKKPSYSHESYEYKKPSYSHESYEYKKPSYSHEYKEPSYPSSHEHHYNAVLPPSILPQGAYPIHQPTITNTGETIIENLVGGISFDCRGRTTGHWRDGKYCDIFHACVFGIQRKTYVCPYVGERTYYDEQSRRFVSLFFR
jgi:hypothetical protein